jgi:hypothetical protein
MRREAGNSRDIATRRIEDFMSTAHFEGSKARRWIRLAIPDV